MPNSDYNAYQELEYNDSQQLHWERATALNPDGSPVYSRLMARGAVRSGKTMVDLDIARQRAWDYPGIRIVVISPSWEGFRNSVLKSMKLLMPRSMLHGSHETWKNQSGSTTLFESKDPDVPSEFIYGGAAGGSDDTDVTKWGSSECGLVVIVESQGISREVYDFFSTRLSQKCPPSKVFPNGTYPPLQMLCDSMCEVGTGWAKTIFVDQQLQGHKLTRFKTIDNERNLVKGYIESQKVGKSQQWIDRYLNAEEGSFEGQIYDNFNEAIHIIGYDDSMARISAWGNNVVWSLGLDWGVHNPASVGLYCKMPNGTEIRVDEVYQAGLTPRQLHELCVNKGFRPSERWCAGDTSIANIESDGQSVKTDLQRLGWRFVEINKRYEEGLPLCRDSLNTNPATGEPYFMVTDICHNFKREVLAYQYDKQKEVPKKVNDHSMDEWRYHRTAWASGRTPKVIEGRPVTTIVDDVKQITENQPSAVISGDSTGYQPPSLARGGLVRPFGVRNRTRKLFTPYR